MQPLFGIETEYGITVEGKDKLDVVAESIALVRCYPQKETALKWDYSLEDPFLDARGFRASELLQDVDEPADARADRGALSWAEIKSDRVLSNGARFYNDHAHPEYSTPECSTLADLAAHDRAGECVLRLCARRRNRRIAPLTVRLYKNNTDFRGHSYGCHDNYLVPRAVAFNSLAAGMIPFLVTRQIFAGAGKLGVESETHEPTERGHFQISQRSDFFSVLMSIDTMRRRPIINTRDEPHANPAAHRRFHVIVGDANMNDFATALKVGTTQLALELVAAGRQPAIELEDPVAALRSISRDPECRWTLRRAGGTTISAVDLQRLYLGAAREHLDLADPERARLADEWEAVLDDLDRDYWKCLDRVDWVAKKWLLATMAQDEKLDWTDPWLESIDLEYHNIDPENGLFHALRQEGRVRSWTTPDRVWKAIRHPPRMSRAYFRGRCVRKFGRRLSSVQWDEVEFEQDGGRFRINLEDLFAPADILRYNELVDRASSPATLLRELGKIP